MSIDKKIDYVEQDGYNNYIKNSDSVTVPRKFKSRKDATPTKLAYITDAEAKMLKKQNKGTPHKGPKNIPSYDSFDAQGNYTSGTAMSAAETGSTNERDRAEVRASNIGGPKSLAPGAKSQEELALRAAAINAGAGQRVNPGFFDSRNTISPAELAMAKAYRQDPNNLFAKQAYRNTRGGGLGSFISGGGLLGGVVRGIGQAFGLGKTYDQPTYDMSGYNSLGLGGTGQEGFGVPTQQGDYDVLGNKINEITGEITSPTGQSLGFLPGYPGSDTGGITTIPTGGANDYTQNIVETINEIVDDNIPGEDLLLRYLGDASTLNPEAAGVNSVAELRDLQKQRAEDILTT